VIFRHKRLHSIDGWKPILFDKAHSAHAETAQWVVNFLGHDSPAADHHQPPPSPKATTTPAEHRLSSASNEFEESFEFAGGSPKTEAEEEEEALNCVSAGILLSRSKRHSFLENVVGPLYPALYLSQVFSDCDTNRTGRPLLGDSD
jgi:hypothetical protein